MLKKKEDGRIYIAYDREILMAVFAEQDILAGRCVDARSRLRVLISKAGGPLPTEEERKI